MYRLSLILLLLAPTLAFAQDQERPGTVTYAEREVFVGEAAIDPEASTIVATEQRLRTGDGNAEVVFAPGATIFLDSETEVEMVSPNVMAAAIRLHAGSIIVEASKVWGELLVHIGDAEFAIGDRGEYRVDVEDGSFTAHLLKGAAVVRVAGGEQGLKKKQVAEVGGDGVQVAKFKNLPQDALAAWHSQRGDAKRASVYQAQRPFGLGDLPDRETSGVSALDDRPGSRPSTVTDDRATAPGGR